MDSSCLNPASPRDYQKKLRITDCLVKGMRTRISPLCPEETLLSLFQDGNPLIKTPLPNYQQLGNVQAKVLVNERPATCQESTGTLQYISEKTFHLCEGDHIPFDRDIRQQMEVRFEQVKRRRRQQDSRTLHSIHNAPRKQRV